MSDACVSAAILRHVDPLAEHDCLVSYSLATASIQRLSWGQFGSLVQQLSRHLQQAGIGRGDRVFLCGRFGSLWQAAFVAAMGVGAVPTLMSWPTPKQDPALFWAEYDAVLTRVAPALIWAEPEFVDDLRRSAAPSTVVATMPPLDLQAPTDAAELRALPGGGRGDLALVQYSSGTTGLRKGVPLTHAHVLGSARATAQALGLTPSDKVASWLPLYHDMGLIAGFLLPLIHGLTIVQQDPFEWVEQPDSLLRMMAQEQATHCWMPNFGFSHLTRTTSPDFQADLSGVRAMISCSETVKAQTLDDFARRFAPLGLAPQALQAMYAMAETVFAVTAPRPSAAPRRLELDGTTLISNGPVLPGLEVRGGVDAPAELDIRGDWVFEGYGDGHADAGSDPESSRDGGWFASGDLGVVRDGEVFVTGRIKDLIIFHGVNYYAHDVEAAVATVPGIRPGRVVAFGEFDADTGSEQVVVLAEPLDPLGVEVAALRRAIRDAVAERYRVAVGHVGLVPANWLVKTTSGKISRSLNQQRWRENPVSIQTAKPAASAAPTVSGSTLPEETPTWADDEIAALVRDVVADTFDVDPAGLGPQTVASDVPGWDSLGHTVLMIRLGKRRGTPIPESIAARAVDLGDLVRRLKEAR